MLDWIVRILINAAALIVAARVVPQIDLKIGAFGVDWVKVAVVALVFALVNTYIKPIVKLLSLPLTLITLGLVAFVINAALFLLVAWISDQIFPGILRIGGFPAKGLTSDAIVGALLGSIVISVVATLLGLANFGRKAMGLR